LLKSPFILAVNPIKAEAGSMRFSDSQFRKSTGFRRAEWQARLKAHSARVSRRRSSVYSETTASGAKVLTVALVVNVSASFTVFPSLSTDV
jgi:hypothetical protein